MGARKRVAMAVAAAVWALLGTSVPAASSTSPGRTVFPPRTPVPSEDWLGTVNHYRAQAGVPLVTADADGSAGIGLHLEYLANTPASLRVGEYANAHTENPASPWYTPEGDHAGRSSNLGAGPSDRLAIERWLTAPFHAIGILRPGLTTSAFARDASGAAGLDVISGLGPGPRVPKVVLFPGPGSVTFLTRFESERPDPTEPCGLGFTGLPLIAMLAGPPPAGTSASVRTPDGRLVTEGAELCVVTASSFTTTDAVYGTMGASILESTNAVLVIPRAPLAEGTHEVTVLGDDGPLVTWSFTAASEFDDVVGDEYFATPVRWLSSNAITGGTSEHLFGPGVNVTRGQMAAFLHRFAGSPTPSAPLRYDDVEPDAYYVDAVRWLDEQAITEGSGASGTFRPLVDVTRGQMAAFLHRLAGQPAPTEPSRFVDVRSDSYYSNAVRWLDEHGITTGVTASTFGPNASVTRGQLAAFLYRLDEVLRATR